jgi:hypothetical protein
MSTWRCIVIILRIRIRRENELPVVVLRERIWLERANGTSRIPPPVCGVTVGSNAVLGVFPESASRIPARWTFL